MSRCRKPNGRFKSCTVGHRRGGGQRVEAAATAYRYGFYWSRGAYHRKRGPLSVEIVLEGDGLVQVNVRYEGNLVSTPTFVSENDVEQAMRSAITHWTRLQAYAAREDAKSFRPEGARASHPRGC